MKNKMITLDDKALLIAQDIGNFSAWVREQLHAYDNHGDATALVDHLNGLIARMWSCIVYECQLDDVSRSRWLYDVEKKMAEGVK